MQNGWTLKKFRIVDLRKEKSKIFKKNARKQIFYYTNTAQFTTSNEWKDYQKMKFKNIGMLVHDESHGSSAEQTKDFLIHMRDKVVVKLLGFSATPMRETKKSQSNTMEVYGNGGQLETIYQLGLYDAIDNGYMSKFKFSIMKMEQEYIEKDDIDYDEDGATVYLITNNGIEEIIKMINERLPTMPRKNVVVWCRNRKDLKRIFELFKKRQSKHKNIVDTKIYCTFSVQEKDDEFINKWELNRDNIEGSGYVSEFKEQDNVILFAIQRLGEGFDFPELKWGIRAYITHDINMILEYQRLGRFTRSITQWNSDSWLQNDAAIKFNQCQNKEIGMYTIILTNDNKNSLEYSFAKMQVELTNFIDGFETTGREKKIHNNPYINNDGIDKLFDISFLHEIDSDVCKQVYVRLMECDIKARYAQYREFVQNEMKKYSGLSKKTLYIELTKKNIGIIDDPEKEFGNYFKGWSDLFGEINDIIPETEVCELLLQKENIVKYRKSINTYTGCIEYINFVSSLYDDQIPDATSWDTHYESNIDDIVGKIQRKYSHKLYTKNK